MRVGGITDISTVDWTGNVTFVVFFAGCNFKCPYCQNSQFIPLNSGQEISIDGIDERLKFSLKLIDAIVVSGGEPTLQPEALKNVLRLAKKYEFKTMIQTNGSRPQVIEELLKEGILDFVALDFKTSPEKYHLVGGNAPLQALRILQEYNLDYEVRTTLASEVVIYEDLEIIKGFIPDGCKWVHQEVRNFVGDVVK